MCALISLLTCCLLGLLLVTAGCCCPGACDSLCDGSPPSSLQVSIGGLGNDVGTCCTPLNADWVLTYSDVTCQWTYGEADYCSSYDLGIDAWISDEGGGNYKLNVQLTVRGPFFANMITLNFSQTYAGMPTCSSWDTESLTFDSVTEGDTATFDCDTTSVSCYVTAV